MVAVFVAVLVARAGDDAVSPSAGDHASAVRQYREERLVRSEMTVMTGGYPSYQNSYYGVPRMWRTWDVRKGDGPSLATAAFAATVGDTATVTEMRKRRRAATGAAIALGALGGGLAIGSMVAMQTSDEPVDGAVGLFTFGLVLAASAAIPPATYGAHNRIIGKIYTTDDADRWIASYNAALGTRLGLSEQEVAPIDPSL